MTMPLFSLPRIFHSALLAAMLLLPFAVAHAQAPHTGARAFWCKNPNGTVALQTESCKPGTEVRSEPVGPKGAVAPRPLERTGPPPASPAAAAAARSAPASAAPAAAPAAQAAASAPRRSTVKAGALAVFKISGLALLLALVGYWRREPIKRWAAIGAALGALLAFLTW